MRRTGRTTRQIDQAIQELFTTGKTELVPHWFESYKEAMQQERSRMAKIMWQRLTLEHGMNKDHFKDCYKNMQKGVFEFTRSIALELEIQSR